MDGSPRHLSKPQLTITCMNGTSCVVNNERRMLVSDLKRILERMLQIPAVEQRIVLGSNEQNDWDTVPSGNADLILVRAARHPDFGRWLRKAACTPSALSDAPDQIRNDRNFFLAAFLRNTWYHGNVSTVLSCAAAELRDDFDVVRFAVRRNASALQFASKALQGDQKLVSIAVQENPVAAMQFAAKEMRSDHVIALQAVRKDWRNLHLFDASVRSDHIIALHAVRQDWRSLHLFDASVRSDHSIALQAIRKDWRSLHLFDANVRMNHKVVRKAVKQCGLAFEHADPSLQKDRGIVLLAVQRNASALAYVDPGMLSDRSLMVEVVQRNGPALEFLADPFRKDRTIVAKAVQQNASSLVFAADELKKDHEFLLRIVHENGRALEYVPAEDLTFDLLQAALAWARPMVGAGMKLCALPPCLKTHPELLAIALESCRFKDTFTRLRLAEALGYREAVLEMIRADATLLLNASYASCMDREIVLAAVQQDGRLLSMAQCAALRDQEVVLAAVSQNGLALQSVDDCLSQEYEVVYAAVQNNHRAKEFADNHQAVWDARHSFPYLYCCHFCYSLRPRRRQYHGLQFKEDGEVEAEGNTLCKSDGRQCRADRRRLRAKQQRARGRR